MSLSDITKAALELPSRERLILARTLLEKAEAGTDAGAAEAWDEEIERRIRLLDSGLAKGRGFNDVLQEIDRRFAR